MNDMRHLRFLLRCWCEFRDWWLLTRELPPQMNAEVQAEWECYSRGQFDYPGSKL